MVSESPNIKKLYYSIGEVSEMTDLKPYVLRFWETEFKQLNPPKNRAGNRTYRQKDIDLIQKIKSLLYDQKYTIEGARAKLDAETETDGSMDLTVEKDQSVTKEQKEVLLEMRRGLQEILEIIQE